MSAPIKIENGQLKFAVVHLQTPEALVWVGFGQDPLNNDDDQVRQERILARRRYPHVPSGMSVGNIEEEGLFAHCEPIPLSDDRSDSGSYYALDVSRWPAGVYRLNYHTLPGIASPVGSPLHPEKRDADVSWPRWWKDWTRKERELARPFMHKNLNGTGSCFRILVRPDRSIEPFGDLDFQGED